MNRFAVLSDANANIEALIAVLADIDAQQNGVPPIVFLGDAIGYGADPIPCMAILRNCCCVYLRGYLENHMIEAKHNEFSSHFLRESIEHAKRMLMATGDYWDWLFNRPRTFAEQHAMAVHTDPRGANCKALFLESVKFGERLRKAVFPLFSHVLFVGCNHSPWIVLEDGTSFTAQELGYEYELSPNSKAIVSVGSVGQSRDGDPRACYVLAFQNTIQWRRVNYDVNTAASKIEATYSSGNGYAKALRQGMCR